MMRKKKRKEERILINNNNIGEESHVWAFRTHLRWLAWPRENRLPNMWGRKRNTSLPFRLTKSNNDDLKLPVCEQVQKILDRLSQLEPELGDAAKKNSAIRQSAQKFEG